VTIPTNEPLEQRAGLTWQWTREDLDDYPASTWTLKYWFKKTGSSGANFSITATADGDDFAVTVAAATTAAYTAGDYTWAAIVTAGSEAFEVDKGTFKLLPRYDAAANVDDRSHARKMLDAIEATLQGKATKDQLAYTIGGRSLQRIPPLDLESWREKYRNEVAAEEADERIRNGLPNNSRLYARL